MKQAAEEQRKSLKEELKGKFVFLKFDCATRIQTNYLGINVRYLQGTERRTRTLSVIDTKSRHTARDLKSMILDTLELYELPLENVLISVTDNATNMVKTIDLLNEVMFHFKFHLLRLCAI